MNAIRSIGPRIVAAAIASLFVAAACVAGSPLNTILGSSGSTLVTLAPTASPNPSVVPSVRDVQPPAPTHADAPASSVIGHITAGPICPVETVPPNPSCTPKPVAGVTVIATDSAGIEAGRAISKADGSYALELVPGRYVLTPQPLDGQSLRAPAAKSVIVQASADPLVVDFTYDTGIR